MTQEGNWCPKKVSMLPRCSLHVGGSATPVAAALNYNDQKKYEGKAGDSTLNMDTTTRHPMDAIEHML